MPAQADQRQTALTEWTSQHLGYELTVEPVAGDASNRRYFRLREGEQSWIVMDAPPALEDCRPFIDVTRRLLQAGLHAPEIIASDLQQGFLLLEDLGDDLYRDIIVEQQAAQQYGPVFDALVKLANEVNADGLPDYNATRLQRELNLFSDWYAPRHARQPLNEAEHADWQTICKALIKTALSQPQVFVHRDFHSCNVLFTHVNNPGIIDYQDAVRGPITYDLISWLLDRYIAWPREQLVEWYEQHRQRLQLNIESGEWLRWCDWMGLQRNLKVLGIFARLAYRDGKTGYIDLMPNFRQYVSQTAYLYTETQALVPMLKQRPCTR